VVRRAVAVAAVGIAAAVGGCAAGGHAASASSSAGGADGSARAAAGYLTIAVAGNQRLDADFDRVRGPDRGNLAAAGVDLRDIAGTERLFDQRLAALELPSGTEAWAHDLITVNQARAALSTRAAASTSLAQLESYQRRLTAADVPVEQAVSAIRAELGLPAPDTD
jgi:hypothetical protein